MKLYSTNNENHVVDLQEAVFKGLPPDNGLYMPTKIPKLPSSFFDSIENKTIQEIAFEVCKSLFVGAISDADIKNIIEKSIIFDAPAVHVENNMYSLELYHGPTLAFKDFGARFMAQLMAYFLGKKDNNINILVATSGDTGGAVASGFFKTKGINVTILYPSGKVSASQEKQLTTLGHNITALEIDGTFDDCQKLVKTAFLDTELTQKVNLSSANSINIARLIPQSFYYYAAYSQLKKLGKPIVFSIPSGNFGNICAGMIAQKMGLPVHHFVASVNRNDTFTHFLNTGNYLPKPSVATLSNAMDVGNPSNFVRINELFNKDLGVIKNHVSSYSFDDNITQDAIREIFNRTGYMMDPHGAVSYLGLMKYLGTKKENLTGVFLHTAHPAKFVDTYEEDMKPKVKIPKALADLEHLQKKSIKMANNFEIFKAFLLQ